jgi:hypothetical protein
MSYFPLYCFLLDITVLLDQFGLFVELCAGSLPNALTLSRLADCA